MAPTMAVQVIDWAIQAHGAAGSRDFLLATPSRARSRFASPMARTRCTE